MPDHDGNKASATAIPAASKAQVINNVTAAEDNGGEASPDEIDGKLPSGSSVDDDVEYVQGHPVIRNGTWAPRVNTDTILRSSIADPSVQAWTYPGSSCRIAMTAILP